MSWTDADLAAPRSRAIRAIRRRRAATRVAMLAPLLLLLWPRMPDPQQLALKVSTPVVESVPLPGLPPPKRRPAPVQEKKQIVVKIFTDDPNIVIYWISD
jgi:hypothetical protein